MNIGKTKIGRISDNIEFHYFMNPFLTCCECRKWLFLKKGIRLNKFGGLSAYDFYHCMNCVETDDYKIDLKTGWVNLKRKVS